MFKDNKKDNISKYTRNMFVFLGVIFLIYIFLTFYFLGVNFKFFQLANINYDTKSNFFNFVVIIAFVPALIFMFICLFFGKMNKIFVGEKVGSFANVAKRIFLGIACGFMLLLIVCSFFASFISEKTYMSIMLFLLCSIIFLVDIIIFLERISEMGGKHKVKNINYNIKFCSYEDLKKYLNLKFNVKELKTYEEKNCRLEYCTFVEGNRIKCFVLVHLDKMNREIYSDYYEEGFVDFFDYEFKDINISDKEFFVYYIFVVDESNDTFIELINSITPMQDRYYFLGVGIDLKKDKLYITGYDKKKYKKEYDILVNEFDRIITDIKINK